MRKKLKIFMELILAMTLIFGSTLCYASDGDVVEGNKTHWTKDIKHRYSCLL